MYGFIQRDYLNYNILEFLSLSFQTVDIIEILNSEKHIFLYGLGLVFRFFFLLSSPFKRLCSLICFCNKLTAHFLSLELFLVLVYSHYAIQLTLLDIQD